MLLELPSSYLVKQAGEEAIYTYADELAYKASSGPGFGPSVILGPAGELDRVLREHNTNRQADKALYYYLYKRHPWVYACIELICQTAAQDRHTYPSKDKPNGDGSPYGRVSISKKAGEDDGDEGDLGPEPTDGMEFLEQFFAEVNPYEDFSELLASIYRDVLVSGEAFILKQRKGAKVVNGPLGPESQEDSVNASGKYSHVVQDKNAEVVGLYRIPSRYTQAIAGPNGYPAKFRQYSDGGGFREYAVEDVVFIKTPDPDDASRGLSPLEALDLSLATDLSAAKYNEAFFRNGAKAGMVFSAQGLSEHEIRRNQEWIETKYVRPENAHKPMLLLGNIELVRDGSTTQRDMDFIQLRQFTRDDICAVYSVPLSKLLHSENSLGQAGKLSDDATFRADTVGPLQTRVYEALNRQLMKRDFKDKPLLVPPRQEKIRLDLLEAAKSLVQIGGTGNEARAIVHLPEIEHETMDLPLFLTPGLRSLITDESAQPAASAGEPLAAGADTQAKRPDVTSRRSKPAQTQARVQRGRGMKTRS